MWMANPCTRAQRQKLIDIFSERPDSRQKAGVGKQKRSAHHSQDGATIANHKVVPSGNHADEDKYAAKEDRLDGDSHETTKDSDSDCSNHSWSDSSADGRSDKTRKHQNAKNLKNSDECRRKITKESKTDITSKTNHAFKHTHIKEEPCDIKIVNVVSLAKASFDTKLNSAPNKEKQDVKTSHGTDKHKKSNSEHKKSSSHHRKSSGEHKKSRSEHKKSRSEHKKSSSDRKSIDMHKKTATLDSAKSVKPPKTVQTKSTPKDGIEQKCIENLNTNGHIPKLAVEQNNSSFTRSDDDNRKEDGHTERDEPTLDDILSSPANRQSISPRDSRYSQFDTVAIDKALNLAIDKNQAVADQSERKSSKKSTGSTAGDRDLDRSTDISNELDPVVYGGLLGSCIKASVRRTSLVSSMAGEKPRKPQQKKRVSFSDSRTVYKVDSRTPVISTGSKAIIGYREPCGYHETSREHDRALYNHVKDDSEKMRLHDLVRTKWVESVDPLVTTVENGNDENSLDASEIEKDCISGNSLIMGSPEQNKVHDLLEEVFNESKRSNSRSSCVQTESEMSFDPHNSDVELETIDVWYPSPSNSSEKIADGAKNCSPTQTHQTENTRTNMDESDTAKGPFAEEIDTNNLQQDDKDRPSKNSKKCQKDRHLEKEDRSPNYSSLIIGASPEVKLNKESACAITESKQSVNADDNVSRSIKFCPPKNRDTNDKEGLPRASSAFDNAMSASLNRRDRSSEGKTSKKEESRGYLKKEKNRSSIEKGMPTEEGLSISQALKNKLPDRSPKKHKHVRQRSEPGKVISQSPVRKHREEGFASNLSKHKQRDKIQSNNHTEAITNRNDRFSFGDKNRVQCHDKRRKSSDYFSERSGADSHDANQSVLSRSYRDLDSRPGYDSYNRRHSDPPFKIDRRKSTGSLPNRERQRTCGSKGHIMDIPRTAENDRNKHKSPQRRDKRQSSERKSNSSHSRKPSENRSDKNEKTKQGHNQKEGAHDKTARDTEKTRLLIDESSPKSQSENPTPSKHQNHKTTSSTKPRYRRNGKNRRNSSDKMHPTSDKIVTTSPARRHLDSSPKTRYSQVNHAEGYPRQDTSSRLLTVLTETLDSTGLSEAQARELSTSVHAGEIESLLLSIFERKGAISDMNDKIQRLESQMSLNGGGKSTLKGVSDLRNGVNDLGEGVSDLKKGVSDLRGLQPYGFYNDCRLDRGLTNHVSPFPTVKTTTNERTNQKPVAAVSGLATTHKGTNENKEASTNTRGCVYGSVAITKSTSATHWRENVKKNGLENLNKSDFASDNANVSPHAQHEPMKNQLPNKSSASNQDLRYRFIS